MSIVQSYGLHRAGGGIAFLLQPKGSQNALGVDLPSPFKVELANRVVCPHAIDLTQADTTIEEIDDPLLKCLAPTPGQGAFLLEDPGHSVTSVIDQLTRLITPIRPTMFPIWAKPTWSFAAEFAVTNLGALVFTGVELRQLPRVIAMSDLARRSRRRAVFVTREKVPTPEGVQRITTQLTAEVGSLPLERLGAGLLKKAMLQ